MIVLGEIFSVHNCIDFVLFEIQPNKQRVQYGTVVNENLATPRPGPSLDSVADRRTAGLGAPEIGPADSNLKNLDHDFGAVLALGPPRYMDTPVF